MTDTRLPSRIDLQSHSVRVSRMLQQHGLLAILVGLIGGFALVAVLIGGLSASPLPVFIELHVPGSARGWIGFHLGMLMNGILALVLDRVLVERELSRTRRNLIAGGIVLAVWGNCAFYLFSMFAPNRGLTAGSNALGSANVFGDLAYYPAIAGAIALIVAVSLLFLAPSINAHPSGCESDD